MGVGWVYFSSVSARLIGANKFIALKVFKSFPFFAVSATSDRGEDPERIGIQIYLVTLIDRDIRGPVNFCADVLQNLLRSC